MAGTELQLEVTAGPALGLAFAVDERLVIGRQSEGHGRLADDPELSRHHARIYRQPDGTYAVEDLASTNGTMVNGARITAPALLRTGDTIEVGGTTMAVAFAPSLAPPPAPEPPPPVVDARAATVTVDTTPEMRAAGAAPPPTEPVSAPPPAPPMPESVPPPIVAPAPPEPEPEPPAPLSPPTEPMAAPPPIVEPEPPAPEPEPPAPEPEPPAPEPEPPAPEPEPPAPEPEPATAEAPARQPRLELRLIVDPEQGEAEIQLDGASDPIRLSYRDGRWQQAEE